MACFNPLKGYLSRTLSVDGKRPVVFSVREGYADKSVNVPCGQCIGCRLERSRQWAIRCVHEAQLHDQNCFITLTYNDENLPLNGGLIIDDFQRFMKRLRKQFSDVKIRFFHCGEYGEQSQRPHYHAIIFNFDFPDKKLFKTTNGVRVYTSEILQRLWSYGFSTVGDVTFESAAYVARYCVKKITGKAAAAHYGDRLPDYVTMSRRPGIASGWYDKFKTDVYPHDYIMIRGGVKCRPPKYYDKKLEQDSEGKWSLEYIKKARRLMAALHAEDNTPERLEVKEKIKLAQIKSLKREL